MNRELSVCTIRKAAIFVDPVTDKAPKMGKGALLMKQGGVPCKEQC